MSNETKTNRRDPSQLETRTIHEVLEQLCPGTRVSAVRVGPRSYSNRLWVADTDEGALLVRIPGRDVDPDRVRNSIVAARLASEAGIPVTRLRAFAPVTELGFPVVVQEFQPGESATSVMERNPAAVTGFASALGHWIGLLHGIRRDTFGPVLSSESTAWRTLVRSRTTEALAALDEDALPADPAQIEVALEAALSEHPPAESASLTHGDIYFDNMLVHDGRAVCLLDFEHAHFQDRFAEFGKVTELLFEWWPASREPFMSSYRAHFPAHSSDPGRLRLATGLYALGQLAYFHRWQRDLVPTYRDRLGRWLAQR